jgi:hypothetical protein
MKIELRRLPDIKPYPQNPRVNDDAIDAVAASIREFGFRQPVVVDDEGVIVVGHTRWKAAKKLALDKVPVHVAKDLTPAQIKAYRIADNQTNTLAESTIALATESAVGTSAPRSQLKTCRRSANRWTQSFEMRLSPISHSGLSACSGKTKASKRWPAIVPQTQVPAPAGRREILVMCRSSPNSRSLHSLVMVSAPCSGY